MTLRITLFVLVSSMCAFGKITTRDMYDDCKMARRMAEHTRLNTDTDYGLGMCTGYMLGFWYGTARSPLFEKGVEGASADALARSFINYVDAHPTAIDDDAGLNLTLMNARLADGFLKLSKKKHEHRRPVGKREPDAACRALRSIMIQFDGRANETSIANASWFSPQLRRLTIRI